MDKIKFELTNEKFLIILSKDASLLEIENELKNNIYLLKNFDFNNKSIPIVIKGKKLTEAEFRKLATIIKEKADTKITYQMPNSLGLHNIQKTYEINSDITQTKFIHTSLRSGQKIEYDGSLVIIGDVNPGSEIIASENIVILGALYGIAHAGAKGNKKAFITANLIDAPQLRIANIVTGFSKNDYQDDTIYRYAKIKHDKIILE